MTTVVKNYNSFGDIYNPEAALSVFKKANHYFSNNELNKAQFLYQEISNINDHANFNLGYMYIQENDLTKLRFLYEKSSNKSNLRSLFDFFKKKNENNIIPPKAPLITIILSVTNNEKSIIKCLESIIKQSYSYLEVIIIGNFNDNISELIKSQITVRNTSIKFDNITNGITSLSDQKNNALDIAQGFYTLFLNSNDFIASDYISNFINDINNSPLDIIQASGFQVINSDKKYLFKNSKAQFNDFQHPLFHFHESTLISDKLFRTKFLKDNNIKFYDHKLTHDLIFTNQAYYYADHIILCENNDGYFYSNYENHQVLESGRIYNESDLLAYSFIKNWIDENNIDKTYQDIIHFKIVSSYLPFVHQKNNLNIEYKEFLNAIDIEKIKNFFNVIGSKYRKSNFLNSFESDIKPILTQPKVSVIIPIHNVEDYLKNCLDSVVNQTLKDIEIILINDGSTDNSLNIIHEYLVNDNRIVLINNTEASGNSGTPRNQGIYKARGEYIAFVDSDDWIELNMFERLYARGVKSNSDIVCSGGFFRENADGTTITEKIINSRFIPTESERSKLFLSSHFPIVWYRIYKREMILDNHILFGEVKTSADLPFAFKSLLKANQVDKIEEIFYHYRFGRPGSTIERRQGTGAFEMYKSYDNIVDYLKKHNLYDEYITFVMYKAVGDYFYNSKFISDDLKNDFKEKLANLIQAHKINNYGLFSENARKFLDILKTFKNPTPSNLTLDESKPTVSIIIPCHNVETYLSRCLDSILKQHLQDIEIIIINDGSTDGTLDIIKRYYSENPSIKVINCNIPSGNAGTPRNMGMCIAKGEYIGFVDADDWVTPSMFEKLYESAKNEKAEIASQSGFFRHDGKVADPQKINYIEISKSENREKAFESSYFSNIWNRIYKTELIKNNCIYFPRIYLAEDMSFSFVAHAFAQKTKKVNGSWYYYNYNRKDSTTELRMGRKGFEILRSFYDVSKYFKSFKIYDQYAAHLVYKKINSLWYTYDRMEKDLKDEFLTEMKSLYHEALSPYIDKTLFTENELKKLSILDA
ncbi:hypothetical protein B9T31_06915 [Acinetobacter sp. ANC 4558]|uniref:glycosyltransferase family 2 protein n=1 Tax=Acinetobacter sp. ANC 4558 TaxID=1977876 RepID=UPI000A3471DF|nr:glycosyltransferase [Acinetobacter sp. ANC 4558]OTG86721.1 hypothetical protein B9T31_06915 [Acinetobacter sp. ANC 4558]